MAAWPFDAASSSGVTPYRLAAPPRRPRESRVTRSASPARAAQCSAVVPSASGALTSARCWINVRTVAESPFLAAWTTRSVGRRWSRDADNTQRCDDAGHVSFLHAVILRF